MLNPFSVFDETERVKGSATTHTCLTIPDGSDDKWFDYLYTADGTTNSKSARLSWKSSEGHVSRLIIELDEPEALVLSYADMIIAGVLDYICFAKEIPLGIHHIEVYESKTNDLVQLYVVLPYVQKAQLDAQLLSGIGNVPKLLVPLLRLFREAVNSTNPYYRLLCLYRVGEGLEKVRSLNNQNVKNLESPRKRPKQRIPENEFTRQYFKEWIGKSMHDYLDHVEHNFRNNIAHLIIDESLKLIYDEWTFVKENGIDGISAKVDLPDKQVIQDYKAKGAKVLKTPDVEIVQSGFLKTAKFSTPYEPAQNNTKGLAESNLYLTYTVESVSDQMGIIIRVQLERLDSGDQLVKSFYDRRAQIKLPPVGEPEDYSFILVGDNFESQPVHFRFVVLEHSAGDDITLAVALSIEDS